MKQNPQKLNTFKNRSPLARGAWIETDKIERLHSGGDGRPSQEGRGLKLGAAIDAVEIRGSPLARGAWIETETYPYGDKYV